MSPKGWNRGGAGVEGEKDGEDGKYGGYGDDGGNGRCSEDDKYTLNIASMASMA